MLDTNVVLDWMVFGDPPGLAIGRAIESCAIDWLATVEMRAEHFEVVARDKLRRWLPDVDAQVRLWHLHCKLVEVRQAESECTALRCANPDDQMFVDLAVSARPAWLITRDNALLVLAPALQLLGVEVVTPAAWVAAEK